jgi:adenylate cyclase
MPADRRGATRRRLVFLSGAVPVLFSVVLAVYRPASLGRLDDTTYDVLMRSVRPAPRGDGVVIVDVDERSLASIGQWPWRRNRIGDLIDALRTRGASVVALDVIFAESDRYEPVLARNPPTSNESDDALAARLREGHVVLGYALTFDAARPAEACALRPVALAVVHPSEETGESPYFQATGAVCNLPVLARAAGAAGFLNAAPDGDGILRRVPLLAELQGRTYPSLALSAVSAVTGATDLTLRVENVNASTLSIGDTPVPLDGKSNLLVRYRGRKRTFPYLSAADVLRGSIAADAVRGKIVLVGTTALGTREVVATPLDTLFAGVEVQATVADNLLERTFFYRSPLAPVIESQLVLFLGLGLAVLVSRRGVTAGVLTGITAIGGIWFGSGWLLSSKGIVLSPLYPTIGLVSGLVALTFAKFTVEHRRAERSGRETAAAQRLMVQTLLTLTETRDAETGRHSRRTQQYARVLAQQLAQDPRYREYLSAERIDLLSSLAPLHDIGKVGIPDHILNKPGELTPEERTEMRKHPVLGRDVILKAEQQVGVRDDATLALAKDIVYTHHERWDGTGYPQGLHGDRIPVAGRVIAIVDVYDALVSRALYRPTMSHQEAVNLIVKGKGSHFDPAVVEAFLSVAPMMERISLLPPTSAPV